MPTFYRVVRTNPPTERDFLSARARSRREPTEPELRRVFDGVSVFDSEEGARRQARTVPLLGGFVAAIEIAEDDPIRAERTLRQLGHHTLWAEPTDLMRRVRSVVPVEPRRPDRGG